MVTAQGVEVPLGMPGSAVYQDVKRQIDEDFGSGSFEKIRAKMADMAIES